MKPFGYSGREYYFNLWWFEQYFILQRAFNQLLNLQSTSYFNVIYELSEEKSFLCTTNKYYFVLQIVPDLEYTADQIDYPP